MDRSYLCRVVDFADLFVLSVSARSWDLADFLSDTFDFISSARYGEAFNEDFQLKWTFALSPSCC